MGCQFTTLKQNKVKSHLIFFYIMNGLFMLKFSCSYILGKTSFGRGS